MVVRTIVMSMTLVAVSAFNVPNWLTKATEPDAVPSAAFTDAIGSAELTRIRT